MKMKEIGRFNVSKEITDMLFDKEHKGNSVKDNIDVEMLVTGFIIYDMEGDGYHLKFITHDDKDYYTSSQVFIKEFMRIAKNAEDKPFIVTPIEATSSKGRKYLSIKESIPKSTDNDAWKNMNW